MTDRPRPSRLQVQSQPFSLPEYINAVDCRGDPQLQRIRRIGERLFDVANCVIRLGNTLPSPGTEGGLLSEITTSFCYSMPLSENPVAVPDLRTDPVLSGHAFVANTPYFQFYAASPIHCKEGGVVGAIALLDYSPRTFSDGDRQALADLAGLVERELLFRSVNATQLELERKNKNLRRKSLIDPLIGTWNRGAIMRILAIEATRCDKAGAPLSLIVADLDHFKKINDTFGHPAGDAVLVKVASRLRSCIRPQEALGRYGGEEFLIVLPGSDAVAAMAVAERMRETISAQPEVIGGVTLKLTISAGVASTITFPNATTEELISRADVALYAAKDRGRNCAVQAQQKV
ncbi:MAG TPA: sensor domain-containing diguanylate cyclase [Noviherbaspirillum sp.]|uniref:sensor domain-containing diguanylate cyclase n=1 Tax=Noviherbaspirillum sp. TaxID=1926288 RepID=UPI002DDD14A6|nr:sensor domain-containing diguanylate cyclase [Noviherbaspirillum sp.]HEV2611252.1 sensor domain-containing diguanylate cyclase [Noviherbaspirillum sp.]